MKIRVPTFGLPSPAAIAIGVSILIVFVGIGKLAYYVGYHGLPTGPKFQLGQCARPDWMKNEPEAEAWEEQKRSSRYDVRIIAVGREKYATCHVEIRPAACLQAKQPSDIPGYLVSSERINYFDRGHYEVKCPQQPTEQENEGN